MLHSAEFKYFCKLCTFFFKVQKNYYIIIKLFLLLLNRPITTPFDWSYNNGKLTWFSHEQDPEAKRPVCWTLGLSLIQLSPG